MPNSTLASLTAATAATGGLFYGTQAGADRKFTLSPAGAALCEATSAAAQLTAIGAAGLGANTFTGVQLMSSGSTVGSAPGDYLSIRSNGTTELRISSNAFGIGPSAFLLGIYASGALQPAANSTLFIESIVGARAGVLTYGDIFWNTNDLFLHRGGAATLQLGNNDATTPTTQTIKGMDVTTGVGGRIGIRGGSGSVNGGDVALMVDINGSGAVDALLISGVDASAVFSGNLTGNSIINAVSGFMINGAIGASGSATAANTLTIIGGIITNIA
jgi:hypothetical protein